MEIDTLLEALKDFEKKGKKELSPVLEQFLCHVAKTGETMVPWSQFKSYFIFKLEKVMDDFRASAPEQRGPANPNVECVPFDEMKARILKIVNGYTGIPFTIQRLCELLTEPKRNYTGTEKFLRGVEKNVMVVSCVHPTSEKNGCSGVRMNGVMLPGNPSAFVERKVNGPGTPRPINRQKVPLSSSLATNGLPDSTENKDPNTASGHSKAHSETSVSGPSRVLARNKHLVKEEDEGLEEEQPEVKRLKFLKDGEDGAEEDDEEEEDEEEDEADDTSVETLRPTLAESSSDAKQANAQSSISPEKRDEELEEDEEDSEPASSAAVCEDQEPSSTQTEPCAEESKAGDKEAEREASSEREAPSSADDSPEEPADMDQSEQRAPSGMAVSPEGREAGDESSEHVSSSSSSSSSSCSEENEESTPGATPSDSTTDPPTEGAPESATQDSASAEEPMEVD